MRAVWSFWTKPMREFRSIWLHERGHWLSWVLSVENARRHYPDVALVADREGAHILTEGLGLAFTDVSTELDALADVDPRWWAIGKIRAYGAQKEPFVHIDADAYLWKRLPAIVEHAPIVAQSPEALIDHDFYQPDRLAKLFEKRIGAVPEPWAWYMGRGYQTAACCGIMGGNDIACVKAYADLAWHVALDPRHRVVWQGEEPQYQMMFVEQYLLSAVVEYRRAHRGDGRDVWIQYLFPSANFDRAGEVGFTHVIADAKRSVSVLQRIEEVVRREYPAQYKRCLEFVAAREKEVGERSEQE
jgi:hypothetical protein